MMREIIAIHRSLARIMFIAFILLAISFVLAYITFNNVTEGLLVFSLVFLIAARNTWRDCRD